MREQPMPERQIASRRAGESVREVISRLTATSAPPEVLDAVTAKMEEAIALLDGHGSRRYEGYAEASGAADAPDDRRFFDWSPQLGAANPLAPPIFIDVEGEIVVGRARFGCAYEGPPGSVHGGFVAAAFDEVLGVAQTLSGQVGMTGTLTIRYRRPTPLHTDLRFEASLDGVSGRKVLTSAKLFAVGQLTAEATALFVSVSAERFSALAANRPS